jgi:hypothetical protein
MTRLVVLTGAPTPSSLHWDETALSDLRTTNQDGVVDSMKSPEPSPVYCVQWRQVPTGNKYDSADHHNIDSTPFICSGNAIFPTTAKLTLQNESRHTRTSASTCRSTASMQTTVEVLDDFYDQSFALHEELTAAQRSELQSQVMSQQPSQYSNERTQVGMSSSVELERTALPFQISPQSLHDVKDIQSAAYLQSIEPQTMTVNLVVVIMTLSLPRRVTVGRRWGRAQETQLLEMLVGDDTRAGFEITMWLSKDLQSKGGMAGRNTLELQMQRLRPQDIVLLRNVALCAYQGRVHGQSLRRDVTKVDLLYRRQAHEPDDEGVYSSKKILEPAGQDPVLKKAQRVRQWLMDFVGHHMLDNLGEASRTRQALLPPDTQ